MMGTLLIGALHYAKARPGGNRGKENGKKGWPAFDAVIAMVQESNSENVEKGRPEDHVIDMVEESTSEQKEDKPSPIVCKTKTRTNKKTTTNQITGEVKTKINKKKTNIFCKTESQVTMNHLSP